MTIDLREFERRVRICFPAMYTRAVRIVGCRETAEDVLQEALLKGWQGLGQLREADRLEAWLLRIATREAVAASQAMARARARSMPDGGLELADRDPSPAQLAETGEEAEIAWRAMANLSPRQRAVFVLCGVEGLELKQAAASLNITVGAAKRHLRRARDKLRVALAQLKEDRTQ